MKVLLAFATLVAVASASHHHGLLRSVESGSSSQFRNDDNAGGYQFGYDEQHSSGGSFRRETGDTSGAMTGSYGLTDADGRQRIVNYIADHAGFRAQIQTNEPGTEASNPADVVVNKAGAVQTVVAAPVPVTKVYSAPVALPTPVAQPLLLPTFAPLQQTPIQISSARYSTAPLRATFGPAPVASYAIKQALPAQLTSAWPAPAPLAAPLPAPLPLAPLSLSAVRPIYNRIEQAPLIAEPIDNTPRAFSYSFASSHIAPVAVKAPTYVSQANYVQQQTQDY